MVNSKVKVPAPLGSWMDTSTKRQTDQAYNTMASTSRSKNTGKVFGGRNRSMHMSSQLSHHTDNLQKTASNILGNGHDDKSYHGHMAMKRQRKLGEESLLGTSVSSMSQAPPSLAKHKGRNVSSKFRS